eukprot:COSAG02_NODE_1978_length_10204_cov_8.298268_2_plen_116_part_00
MEHGWNALAAMIARGDDALSFPACESTELSRELSGDPQRKWLEFFPNWRSTEAASLPVMWELSIKLWRRQRSVWAFMPAAGSPGLWRRVRRSATDDRRTAGDDGAVATMTGLPRC